jgi:predicted phosphodiesterase
MYRKDFLKTSALATGAFVFSPNAKTISAGKKIRFGLIADLHHDIMHDAPDRLSAFIKEMNADAPDFIIQMGDFCMPKKENQPLMDIWNQFNGPAYHVIGNHDTDGGYTREQVVNFWKATGKYYSYDAKGFHFVILDGNENNESKDRPPGYARYISRVQIEWLKKDLDQTSLPVIVCCHQGLDNDTGGLENGMMIRYTLEMANKKAGFKKVILVLSGHHHQDYYNHINDIHYVQVNSASYQWLGDNYQEIRYSAEVDKNHPNIKKTVPYKDPLWALIEIEEKGKISIKGKQSVFVGSAPEKMGVDINLYIYPIVPWISDRKLDV